MPTLMRINWKCSSRRAIALYHALMSDGHLP